MIDILMQYGLFLAKSVTIVVALGALVVLVVSLTRRGQADESLEVTHLNGRYDSMTETLRRAILSKKEFKRHAKQLKAQRKREVRQRDAEEDSARQRLFVLDFHGDIRASGIVSLREEISAVLSLAGTDDEVLLRLENAGGLVHGHGLAASQLTRIRERGIPLTVSVDKMAASGGYMMACVGNRILSAPFAVVGSIGVLAQLPNFSRLLEQHGVDFEQIQAGEFKRTLTVFGKNTDEDRRKLKQEIEDTHDLFKDFVAENRPQLDIGKIATGEHWYGTRALEMGLVDKLETSDDYLMKASRNADIYQVTFSAHKSFADRVIAAVHHVAGGLSSEFSAGPTKGLRNLSANA